MRRIGLPGPFDPQKEQEKREIKKRNKRNERKRKGKRQRCSNAVLPSVRRSPARGAARAPRRCLPPLAASLQAAAASGSRLARLAGARAGWLEYGMGDGGMKNAWKMNARANE